MGLLDGKQVWEDKRLYKKMLSLKNSSQLLSVWLPKSEKEFLSSNNKEKLINAYKFAIELMNDNDFVQAFNISNLGKCFDEVLNHYNIYQIKIAKTGLSFLEYINEQTMLKLKQVANEKYVKSSYEADSAVLYGQELLRQEQRKYAESADKVEESISSVEQKLEQHKSKERHSESREFLEKAVTNVSNDINIMDFQGKFPQYTELQALVFSASLGMLTPEKQALVNSIISMGESFDSEFMLDDILIPYLEEKANMKILSDSEKKLFYKKVGYDGAYAYKLVYCILLNVQLLKGKVNKNDLIDSFSWCNKKIDVFLPNDTKESILQSNNMLNGVKR